jgi:peptidoglycan-associated lipoprotein
MSPRKGLRLAALLCILLVAAAAGCSRKPKPSVVPPPEQPAPTTPTPAPTPPPPAPTPAPAFQFQDVFFDFDKYNIRADGRGALDADGKYLVGNSDAKVLLEGHCDERGTVEYNLALGQKRADAAKSYLIKYGVNPDQLSTISYGKERPFALGHDEAAWAQNRRVHFVTQ